MKKNIAFEKDITFKTKIGELTSISLDNDLTLKGENKIVGNFYISGMYKMLETSTMEEEYSYKIPCEIAISDSYDTYDATIDIDDFTYEIINDEILRVNIEVAINNLSKIEEEELLTEDDITNQKDTRDELEELIEEINNNSIDSPCEEKLPPIEELPARTSFIEAKNEALSKEDTYLTYSVYVMKEEDTIEKILEKYKITREELKDYNDLEDITIGSKLVIPSFND